MTNTSPPVSTCQFAALEPSWAGIHSEARLRGLFILGALFNRIIYVHDTQLLDNPHLLHAFQIRSDKDYSLYNHVAALVSENVLRVAIRDATYLPASDKHIPCYSLEDVYRSWLTQDMKDAWVTPADENRLTYVAHLERLVSTTNPVRYPYMDIKSEFMRRTRHSRYAGASSAHFHNYQSLPRAVRERYDAIITREWFSHSDVFDLLTKSKLRLDHPFVQAHGLFDEAAYATWNRSRLLGCDAKTWSSEDAVTLPAAVKAGKRHFADVHAQLEEHAVRTIDGAGISLLATLKPAEVIELRSYANDVFALTDFLDESVLLQNIAELQENYLDAVTNYWDKICQFLRKSRTSLTQERTKIGIFTRNQLPSAASLIGNVASFSINLGLDLLSLPFPAIRQFSVRDREELVSKLSFRFLFYSDNTTLKNLRRAMPERSWLAREMLQVQTE
jgi:hypothetical protein